MNIAMNIRSNYDDSQMMDMAIEAANKAVHFEQYEIQDNDFIYSDYIFEDDSFLRFTRYKKDFKKAFVQVFSGEIK